ncbi:MAG: LysM domain-containing protein [Thermodesulfobacteriota bacterium]|nr:LysM domain-containing protein [Thermodesulfobacteriota bacterium]
MKKTVSIFVGMCIFWMFTPLLWASDIIHEVKQGDTLWDISSTYQGTPWEWPLVWANNPDITNPHLIYPHDRIIISKENNRTIIKIVHKNKEPRVYTPEEIASQKEKTIMVSPEFSRLIYTSSPFKGDGRIIKADNDGIYSTAGDTILLETSSAIAPGCNCAIVSKVQDIMNKDQPAGFLYKIIGSAETKKTESGIVKATITSASREISAGDIILRDPQSIRLISLKTSDTSARKTGQIIDIYGGIYGASKLDLVFMDLGVEQGIQPGSLLDVFSETILKNNADLDEYQGMVLILKTLKASSMGLLVESREDIHKGFLVRGSG